MSTVGTTPTKLRAHVLDDDPNVLATHKKLLELEGYEVTTATTIESSYLALFFGPRCDLFLSDIELSDGLGWDHMKWIRSKGQTMYAVAISGINDENALAKSLESGFNIHLRKPVSVTRLLEVIRNGRDLGDSMNVTISQMNPTVGDIYGIRSKIIADIESAAEQGSNVIVFPELATVGYPPRDLLYQNLLIDAQEQTVQDVKCLVESILSDEGVNITVILGCVVRNTSDTGRPLYNAAAVIRAGREIKYHLKTCLPNYDVFDEMRYFQPGEFTKDNFFTFEVAGKTCGVVVCEEMWNDIDHVARPLYQMDPVEILSRAGATHIFSINASPFRVGVADRRRQMVLNHCIDNSITMICAFQVGGNDEVVFDGSSFVMSTNGLIGSLPSFEECLKTIDTKSKVS